MPLTKAIFTSIAFLALSISEARACSTCKDHPAPAAPQESGNSAYMDDSAPRRDIAAAQKPANDGKMVFKMRADGTVEVTKPASQGTKTSRP